MAVFAAVRKGKACRIVESDRRAVHDFGDERQRLQRARSELFEQEERREVSEVRSCASARTAPSRFSFTSFARTP